MFHVWFSFSSGFGGLFAGWVQLGGAACNVIVVQLWFTCGSALVQLIKDSFGGVLWFGFG